MAQRARALLTEDEVSQLRDAQVAVTVARGGPRQTVLDRQAELRQLHTELVAAREARDAAYARRDRLWRDIAERYPEHSRLAIARAIARYAQVDPTVVFRRLPEGGTDPARPQLTPEQVEQLMSVRTDISECIARVQQLRETKPATPRRVAGRTGRRRTATADEIEQAERARNELIRTIDARHGGGRAYGVVSALAAATGLHRTMIHRILARRTYDEATNRPGVQL